MPDTTQWESRVERFWAEADDADPAALLAAARGIRDLRPPGDPAATYEWASAHDFVGREAAAVPLYREALAGHAGAALDDERRARAVIQLASSLRNVGEAEEAVRLLEGLVGHPSVGAAREAFLALALHDAGRPDEALRVVLSVLAPTLPSYERAVRHYADELTEAAPADDPGDVRSRT